MALKGTEKSKATATKSTPTTSTKSQDKVIEKTSENNDVAEDNFIIDNAEESKLPNPYLGRVEFLEQWTKDNPLFNPSDREGFLSAEKADIFKHMEEYKVVKKVYQKAQQEKEWIGKTGLAYDPILPLAKRAPFEQEPKAEAYLKPYKTKAGAYQAYDIMKEVYVNNIKAYEEYVEKGQSFLVGKYYLNLAKAYEERMEENRTQKNRTQKNPVEKNPKEKIPATLKDSWEQSIGWTYTKNKKDEDSWEEGEKEAYKRNLSPEISALVEQWQKIVPSLPEDRLMQNEEENEIPTASLDKKLIESTMAQARQAARDFAKKERVAAKEQKRENALQKSYKEYNRGFKNEMRGEGAAVPVMHILPKTYGKSSLWDYVASGYGEYKKARAVAVETLTPVIAKQAEKAINVRKKWHQLWHPLEDEAREKALSLPFVEYPKGTKPKRKDLPPPSATVVLDCQGHSETKKEEMEAKSQKEQKKEQKRDPESKGTVPVVTTFLHQKAYKLKPFEEMFLVHKKRTDALREAERKLKEEAVNQKSNRVNGIIAGLKNLKI